MQSEPCRVSVVASRQAALLELQADQLGRRHLQSCNPALLSYAFIIFHCLLHDAFFLLMHVTAEALLETRADMRLKSHFG